VYLTDLPGQNRKPPAAVKADDPVMRAEAEIYVDQCAAWYMLSGAGIARMFPALKDSSAVLAGPSGLLAARGDQRRARGVHHGGADRAGLAGSSTMTRSPRAI
jgi:hypothetical protein